MVGNAAEEGLMLQMGNPSHLDSGRIVVPAAALSGYAAGYLVWRLVPVLTIWAAMAVGVVVCGLVAWRLAAFFAARRAARALAEREAHRAAQVSETQRQIAAMRAGQGKA